MLGTAAIKSTSVTNSALEALGRISVMNNAVPIEIGVDIAIAMTAIRTVSTSTPTMPKLTDVGIPRLRREERETALRSAGTAAVAEEHADRADDARARAKPDTRVTSVKTRSPWPSTARTLRGRCGVSYRGRRARVAEHELERRRCRCSRDAHCFTCTLCDAAWALRLAK